MTNQEWQALEYVKNTNGGATVANFHEDFEPIGVMLWNRLFQLGYVYINLPDDKIYLTDEGKAALAERKSK